MNTEKSIENQMTPDGRMTASVAATYIGVSQFTLERWRREGVGPSFVKLEGKYFYRKTDLDEWIEESVHEH